MRGAGGSMKKFVADRPFADPDAAARKIVEIANDTDAVQDGRIYIEWVNAAFLAVGGRGAFAPGSSTQLLSAGYGGTRAAPT